MYNYPWTIRVTIIAGILYSLPTMVGIMFQIVNMLYGSTETNAVMIICAEFAPYGFFAVMTVVLLVGGMEAICNHFARRRTENI